MRRAIWILAATLPAVVLWAADNAKLTVWDDTTDPAGGGWAAPKADAIKVEVADGGHKSKKSVTFSGKVDASTWMGFGWNWHAWWPTDAGDDATAYKNLVFWTKAESKPDKQLAGLQCWLVSSSNKTGKDKRGKTVQLDAYDKDVADGQWHEIVIPLKDLDGPDLDLTKVWEIDVGMWSQNAQEGSIKLDEIGFDNREVKAK
jgi:hypothetical protein